MPTKTKAPLRFEYWKSNKDKQWYWRLKAGNNEPVCQSEGYKTRASVVKLWRTYFHVVGGSAVDLVDINAEAFEKWKAGVQDKPWVSIRCFPAPKKLAKKTKPVKWGKLNRNWP